MMKIALPIILAALMLHVIYSDTTRYIIPNWLVLALLVLYPVWVFTAPVEVDWPMGLAMAGILLLCSFPLFALGLTGAGDVKLFIALGLFAGLGKVGLLFVLNMALVGGIMAIVIVTLRRVYKYKETKPKILQSKQPAPYGIAIALSFLWILARGDLPGMVGIL